MKAGRLAFFDGTGTGISPVSDTNERVLPESILLLRFGRNAFTKNSLRGEFEFTEADADSVISEFGSRGRDLVIDFEHQSVSGEKAPAAGWIGALEKNAAGLVAKIKYWTKEAEHLILNGEYRYFSPTLYFSRSGKGITAIHSVALTNHPAMHGIPALAAGDTSPVSARDEASETAAPVRNNSRTNSIQGENMNEILEKLGLLTLSESAPGERLSAVLERIGELLAAEKASAEFLAKHAFAAFADADARLDQAKRAETSERIRRAFADGKLTESMREWAVGLAEREPGLFAVWCERAPRIVPDNRFTDGAPVQTERRKVPDEEAKIFAMLGFKPEEIRSV